MSTSPASGGGGARAPHPASPDFFLWIRSLGVVRGRDRVAGGVASGLAHRWGVAPALVRVLFVVAALFLGVGLLVYGLLWLVLPEPDGRIHVQEASHGRWSSGMVGALIATVFGLGGLPTTYSFGNIRWAGPLWAVFWVGILLLVVYGVAASARRHRVSPRASSQGRGAPPDAPPSPADPPPSPAGVTPPSPYAGYTAGPAAYGPNAPTADVHHVGPPLSAVRTHRQGPGGPFTAIVIGLAALAVGGLLALQSTGAIVVDPSTGTLWAVGAAVVGLGIIAAGLRGRTAGVLSVFAIVALIIAAVTEPAYVLSQQHSPTTSAPTSIAQATQGYTATAASAQLDLRALDNSGPLASESVVPVNATMSDLKIEIPKGIPVRVQADGAMSNVQFGGRSASGLALGDSQTYNASAPGATLVVTVHAVMSNVNIEQER
ncbi:PspC domain-containing protein [Sinomonas sp. JGH33]|uniref:PspC domain-containing protein n=1 Tax=Sinomonas terricola TaxID=3110330 RepID=A0ABU5T1G6_9MICC|nr:PspC domain-containing protein [Sinomonas sp. JGH33]MEA5453502.1 PspC domain-containing protein [Sinomonas sp. JGH33]